MLARMTSTIEEAAQGFYAALKELLAGDAQPMLDVWSHADDVTYMSPLGELLVGWDSVRDSWQQQAEMRLGGHVDPAELRHFSSPELGFVVGFERGEVEIDGTMTPVDIRATSMFRVEDGRWRMISHHTDRLA
jgi:ketosteroid isomerase-like protein